MCVFDEIIAGRSYGERRGRKEQGRAGMDVDDFPLNIDMNVDEPSKMACWREKQ